MTVLSMTTTTMLMRTSTISWGNNTYEAEGLSVAGHDEICYATEGGMCGEGERKERKVPSCRVINGFALSVLSSRRWQQRRQQLCVCVLSLFRFCLTAKLEELEFLEHACAQLCAVVCDCDGLLSAALGFHLVLPVNSRLCGSGQAQLFPCFVPAAAQSPAHMSLNLCFWRASAFV